MLMYPPTCAAGVMTGIEPDVYTQSSTQLFPLGTKLETADGRVFRYCKFGASDASPAIARVVFNDNVCPGATGHANTDGFEGAPYAAAAAGDLYVDIADTTARAANFYEDGMLSCFPSGHFCCYRIAGSDVGNGSTHVRVYLDNPGGLKTALTTSTGVTAYCSLFSNVKAAGDTHGHRDYAPVVGVSLNSAFTSAYFGWVQRRGQAIVTPTAYFGDTAGERLCMVASDGTICTAASADPSSGYQIIGYLAAQTVSGYGDLLVFLTLE